jgi:predicted dehydrogenase
MRYLPEVARAKEMIAAGDIGDVLEVRGRGKEDARGGGEDLMLLGSHVLDLFRFFLGNPAWCFARVTEGGAPASKGHVRPGNEGIGPIAGDRIDAAYGGFSSAPATPAYFTSCRGAGSTPSRFGVRVLGTRGALSFEPSSPQKVYMTEDPRWGRDEKGWLAVSVPPDDVSTHLGDAQWLQHANVRIAADLIDAVERNREPVCGIRDARATLEMIWATYESHRTQAAVPLPLRSREHPLSRWA